MFKKIGVSLITFFIFFAFLPTAVFAVDFSIEDVKIVAQLQEDGNVYVEEQHLYNFDGKFNGIIRELVPKKNTNIVNVKAFEDENELMIEKDEYEYRIHRSGKDEDILIKITYTIENGVEVYEDVAQFYWPFFDKRNESTYENMTIYIVPPKEIGMEQVYAFGHDTAYEKESVLEDGAIVFQLGKVPDGKNGDIRAVYPAQLFPSAKITKHTPYLNTILEEEKKYEDKIIAWHENQQSYLSLGKKIVPIGFALLIFICLKDFLKRRREVNSIQRELSNMDGVPKEKLSLAATIGLLNYYQLPPEVLAATLLDLVRKGNVKQIDKDTFQVVHMDGLKEHEQTFIDWMFYDIGENGQFSLQELNQYVKISNNKTKYSTAYAQWAKEVRQEIKESNLYNPHPIYKTFLIVIGLINIPFLVQFVRYDLPILFIGGLGIALFFIIYGIFYYTKSWDARILTYEWKKFEETYKTISSSKWNSWSKDEQMRAFLYGLATGKKEFKKKNEDLVRSFRMDMPTGDVSVASFDPVTLLLLSSAASHSFRSANDAVYDSATSLSSGSSNFSGGGIGGGGGGSGAF